MSASNFARLNPKNCVTRGGASVSRLTTVTGLASTVGRSLARIPISFRRLGSFRRVADDGASGVGIRPASDHRPVIGRESLPQRDRQDDEKQSGRKRQQPAQPDRLSAVRQAEQECLILVRAWVGVRGGYGGRDTSRLADRLGIAAVNERVHAFLGGGRNESRLTQNQRQDLVGGGDLGEVNVGFETGFLDLGDLLRGQCIVEVLGNDVGLESVGSGAGRCGQATAARYLLDAGNQLLGGIAFGNLLADPLRLGRIEHVIEIGEQGSQGQTHGSLLRHGARSMPLPVIVARDGGFRTRFSVQGVGGPSRSISSACCGPSRRMR